MIDVYKRQAVGQAVETSCCIDTNDPKLTEFSLLGSAVSSCIVESLHNPVSYTHLEEANFSFGGTGVLPCNCSCFEAGIHTAFHIADCYYYPYGRKNKMCIRDRADYV